MKRTPGQTEFEEIAQRRGWPLPMVEELLKGSAISEDVLVAARVHFVIDPKAAAKRFGKTAKEWGDGRLPAWFVPYYIPFHADPVLEQAKPLRPFVKKVKKDDGTIVEETQKYAQRRDSGVHAFYSPSLLNGEARVDPKRDIGITEGCKKALACDSAGMACIALNGVSGWHRKGEKALHPELAYIENWEGRNVYLMFDRDSLGNKDVRKQELELGRVLEAKGARVYIVRFPEDAPKLDDFLAAREVADFYGLLAYARENNPLPPDTVAVQGAPAEATALTDLGNAERMVKLHGQDLRYCEALCAWFIWTGKRWERDTTQQVMRRAAQTARSIYAEADGAVDHDARSAIRSHAKTSEGQARLRAIVSLTSMMRSISVRPENLDQDPWLINCDNGTIDLRTGELHQHRREDLITRITSVTYRSDARHDVWDRFLCDATGENLELIDYLQRAVGYSLTGSTREDKLFFIYGPGGRGKGTFVNAILAPLGEYARVADISSFIERKDSGGDRPRPDLVRLMGSRIVLCDEVKRDARLDEGLVKTITGGSPLSVRDLNKGGFEMVPSFKLWLVANDPPIIHAEDTGMWRRMVRIPFTCVPATPDTQLRDKLKTDPDIRAAVFAWAVKGVRRWLDDGLREPKVIKDSNADYHAEMDVIGEFFASQCIFAKDARITRKELREAYERWCKDEGHTPEKSPRRFAARLKEAVHAQGLDGKIETKADQYGWVEQKDKTLKRVVVQRAANAWRFVRVRTGAERAAQAEAEDRTEVGRPDGRAPGTSPGTPGTIPPTRQIVGHTKSQDASEANNSYLPGVPGSTWKRENGEGLPLVEQPGISEETAGPKYLEGATMYLERAENGALPANSNAGAWNDVFSNEPDHDRPDDEFADDAVGWPV